MTLLLLITLIVVVPQDQALPAYYYVDRNLVREAYMALLCQEGRTAIQKLLNDDGNLKVDDPKKLTQFERNDLQECLSRLANGASVELSPNVRQKLRASLNPRTHCSDDRMILSLDLADAREWVRQLRQGSTSEEGLRIRLMRSLKLALSDPCGRIIVP